MTEAEMEIRIVQMIQTLPEEEKRRLYEYILLLYYS